MIRFQQIDKGVYRGGFPTKEDVIALKQNYNIKSIISLDKEHGEDIDSVCKELGIKHVIIPIDVKDISTLKELFKYNLKDLFKTKPVFIHCHVGKDRTGFLSAIYELVFLKRDIKKVLANMFRLGFGIGLNPKLVRLMLKLLRSIGKDENSLDIVDNARDETVSDGTNSCYDITFAPLLDNTRAYPYDFVYDPITETLEDRDKSIKPYKDINFQVGTYDNGAGINGVGPSTNVGGFLNQ
jgi:hypothetical protein